MHAYLPVGTASLSPSTDTKALDEIRQVFAKLPDSLIRGDTPGRFSINVKGGRCESCKGDGVVKAEMHCLWNVYVTCEVCGGNRCDTQTPQVKDKGDRISDVLDMTVDDARAVFSGHPKLLRSRFPPERYVPSRVGAPTALR